MSDNLPEILRDTYLQRIPTLIEKEISYLEKSRKLLELNFPDHALLDIWNAAIHNLRRRVELYGVDIFLSAVKDEPGRKRYNANGDNIAERWTDVDDLVLIEGAARIGVLNRKAGKALEMINWMRNHASPSHDTNDSVTQKDVLGLALILEDNLFKAEMPAPGHSPSGLFEPVRGEHIDVERLEYFRTQIESYKNRDIRTVFGFMLDLLCSGIEPAYSNVLELFPTVWEKATEELKQMAGFRYHSFLQSTDSDDSPDKGARIRLLEFLVGRNAIRYIPDPARASIYRKAARQLAQAKDTPYGWSSEESAASSFAQYGNYVPNIAFEVVYQEILTVWCGNFWGRSGAHNLLKAFIFEVNPDKKIKIARLFQTNKRVQDELFQHNPNEKAVALLEELKNSVSLETFKTEIDVIIKHVRSLHS